MFLKKRIIISLITSTLFLSIFNINYLYANGDNVMINQELIARAKEILKEGGELNFENYDISVSKVEYAMDVSDYLDGANYVVIFLPKRAPNEPPSTGGDYSVYFKVENGEYNFIVVVPGQ